MQTWYDRDVIADHWEKDHSINGAGSNNYPCGRKNETGYLLCHHTEKSISDDLKTNKVNSLNL